MDVIPKLQQFKAKVLVPLAKRYRHGRRVKAAIKADIESTTNIAILSFGDELPRGWINKMKIDWVENESRDDFFNDGDMVLRLRPLDDQDGNLVRASHAFLQKAFFPRAKNVVPKEHREAAVLFTGRKLMAHRNEHLENLYEDIVLEPAIRSNDRILPIMDRYSTLDSKGFFMGAFLREVQAVAIGARFNSTVRGRMREEASALLDHMEDFISRLPKRIPADLWSRRGPITNYAFLLVARPENVATQNVDIFVTHARDAVSNDVDRLYVFGAEENRSFAARVVDAIGKQVPEFQIAEKFSLTHDYRGQAGGYAALLVRSEK